MTAAKRAALASAASAVALPKTFTTAERRQIVTDGFRAFGKKSLPSLTNVERTQPDILDRMTTNRTILSVAVNALNAAGDKTEPTVGAMRGKLEMSTDDMDVAFCNCVNGADMTGDKAAARMAQLG